MNHHAPAAVTGLVVLRVLAISVRNGPRLTPHQEVRVACKKTASRFFVKWDHNLTFDRSGKCVIGNSRWRVYKVLPETYQEEVEA